MSAAARSVRPRRWIVVAAVLAILVCASAIVGHRARENSSADRSPGVAREVADLVEDLGLTLYDVRLEGAEVTRARADDAAVVLRYERAGEFRYTVAVTEAPTGDLCRAAGYGPDGTDPQGGSCTSEGDRMKTEFEEMGSASLRRGGTLVSVDALIIELDDGLQDRALSAIARAERMPVDDLARLLD